MVAKNIQIGVFCFSDVINISSQYLIFYHFFSFLKNNDSTPKHEQNHNFKDFAIKD